MSPCRPLTTLETVWRETPARRATSTMVGRRCGRATGRWYSRNVATLEPMSVTEPIEIRNLAGAALHAQLDRLAAVLEDCVAGGASIGYLAPFSHEQAREAFAAFAAEVEQGRRLLLGAF